MRDVRYAELIGLTRKKWDNDLSPNQRKKVLELPFVSRITGSRIYFTAENDEDAVSEPLKRLLVRLVHSADIHYFYEKEPPSVRLEQRLTDPTSFPNLKFGSDVAEQEREQLHHYFISTTAFRSVRDGLKSVVIGPKGSGKTAILQALTNTASSGYSIVILRRSPVGRHPHCSNGPWNAVRNGCRCPPTDDLIDNA